MQKSGTLNTKKNNSTPLRTQMRLVTSKRRKRLLCVDRSTHLSPGVSSRKPIQEVGQHDASVADVSVYKLYAHVMSRNIYKQYYPKRQLTANGHPCNDVPKQKAHTPQHNPSKYPLLLGMQHENVTTPPPPFHRNVMFLTGAPMQLRKNTHPHTPAAPPRTSLPKPGTCTTQTFSHNTHASNDKNAHIDSPIAHFAHPPTPHPLSTPHPLTSILARTLTTIAPASPLFFSQIALCSITTRRARRVKRLPPSHFLYVVRSRSRRKKTRASNDVASLSSPPPLPL